MQTVRHLAIFGGVCALIRLVSWAYDELDDHEHAPASTRAAALALYAPPSGLLPVAVPGTQSMPVDPLSVMTPPRSPGAQVSAAPEAPVTRPSFMMPTTVDSPGGRMPVGQRSTPEFLAATMNTTPEGRPFAFLGGFVGGLAAGAAVVYSLVKSTGQKVSTEAKKLELGALTSVPVESPSVVSAGASEPPVVAPYIAGGATLQEMLNQISSGRTAMPPLGRQLRAINIGQGRTVVVNMQAVDTVVNESVTTTVEKETETKKETKKDEKEDLLAKEFCYGLPGAANILGKFDPAGFLRDGQADFNPALGDARLDKLEVYRLRESELAHCRVAMLASLGFIVQDKFHPLFGGHGGPALCAYSTPYFAGGAGLNGTCEDQIPIALWVAMIGGAGLAESWRLSVGWTKLDIQTNNPLTKDYRALKEGYYPGDLGFDPLNLRPKDAAAFRDMQEKELSNGRLAMFAAAGFLAQEGVTGQTWGAYWVPDAADAVSSAADAVSSAL